VIGALGGDEDVCETGMSGDGGANEAGGNVRTERVKRVDAIVLVDDATNDVGDATNDVGDATDDVGDVEVETNDERGTALGADGGDVEKGCNAKWYHDCRWPRIHDSMSCGANGGMRWPPMRYIGYY
jgi:hypothetical protein